MAQVKSRRGEYTEATRQALLASASTLFAEQGYAHTSLDAIAGAARVTKGAIYHHFSSKNVLFEEIVDALEATETAQMRAAFDDAPDPASGAVAALDRFLLACSDPVYGGLIFREGPIALGWERWRECEEKYAYALIADMISSLAAAGVISIPASDTLPILVFGMAGSAGQLLARAPDTERARIREECRVPFVALLAGLRR